MIKYMSRRSLPGPALFVVGDPVSFLASRPPATRVPSRIVVDLFGLIDVVLVVLAAVLAELFYIVLILDGERAHQPYLIAGVAGGIVVHYVTRTRKLHDPAAIIAWRSHIGELLLAIGLSFLMLIAVAFLLKISSNYSRGWLLTWFCLSALLLTSSRPAYSRLLRWLAATGYTTRRIAVVGERLPREQLVQSLRSVSGVWMAGMYSAASRERQEGSVGTIADLIAVGQRNEVDEVVIALSDGPQPHTAQLVEKLSVLPVDVWLCQTQFDVPIIATSQLGPLSLLQVQPKPIRDWGYLSKLVFDYVAGAVCLVLFAPLMLAIAIAIKIDSRGPAFFRQRRHGYNHRVITVFKFRTMTVAENDDNVKQARNNDPRVTRLGRFLRRTSLDELPQLFNVMRGEMSLVGPRPHALAHNQYYRDTLDRYASRHCVKPGMTGWAQIKGFRGPTEDPERMRLRVQMDLYYIENWSLWLDLKILAVTPFVGFIHRNAV
jgi:Undecaprenyl-phosphate glucose phosphotransferase